MFSIYTYIHVKINKTSESKVIQEKGKKHVVEKCKNIS